MVHVWFSLGAICQEQFWWCSEVWRWLRLEQLCYTYVVQIGVARYMVCRFSFCSAWVQLCKVSVYVVNMCVLQGVARVHLVQLWFSFGLYCGGLTVVGSVLVHEVI